MEDKKPWLNDDTEADAMKVPCQLPKKRLNDIAKFTWTKRRDLKKKKKEK